MKKYLDPNATYVQKDGVQLVAGVEIGGQTAYRIMSGQKGSSDGGGLGEMDALIIENPQTETLE